jgi:hypothetical protein
MHLLLLAACGTDGVSLGVDPDTHLVDPRSAADKTDPPDAIVDCEGGGDFETISDAIEAAESGDLIHVMPCTYDETIDFGGKALQIVSTSGPEDTIVNARSAAVVRATAGEGPGTSVEGFTLTGGGTSGEAAVSVDFASLRLEDVILSDNAGFSTIYGNSADIQLSGVEMMDNRASYDIAIYMSRGSLVADGLVLDCSGVGTGVYLGHGSGMIDTSNIECGRGNATHWEHAVGRVQRSELVGNVYVLSEDDHYDDFVHLTNSVIRGNVSQTYGSMWIRNSIVDGAVSFTTVYLDTKLEGNIFTGGGACAVSADTNDFTLRNNVFFDNTANVCGLLTEPVGTNGNIGDDPLLDADYALGAGSPAEDAGPEDGGYEDMDGSRNDIGVYGGPYAFGGGW